MRQTTPEQIRGIQNRSILSFDALVGDKDGKGVENRIDMDGKPKPDVRFQAAARGVADIFPSQHFDVLMRETPTKSNNWAVWWSDLMMTMFIMFAALYAFQMPKDQPPKLVQVPMPQQVEPPTPEPVVSDSILERTFESIREAVLQGGFDDVVGVRLVPEKSLRISIAGDLLFDGNKVALKPSSSRILHLVGEVLKKSPYKVMVVGHTDNSPAASPAFASNWEVSTAKACAVGRALILEGGISQDRLIMTGLGDQQPLQPNDSAAGMAANRRMELVLSVENPTDALADEKMAAASKDNVRHWLVKTGTDQERATWNAKR